MHKLFQKFLQLFYFLFNYSKFSTSYFSGHLKIIQIILAKIIKYYFSHSQIYSVPNSICNFRCLPDGFAESVHRFSKCYNLQNTLQAQPYFLFQSVSQPAGCHQHRIDSHCGSLANCLQFVVFP